MSVQDETVANLDAVYQWDTISPYVTHLYMGRLYELKARIHHDIVAHYWTFDTFYRGTWENRGSFLNELGARLAAELMFDIRRNKDAQH